MSTAATTKSRKRLPRLGLSPEKGNEIIVVLLCAAVVLLAASLLSYHPADPALFNHLADDNDRTRNFVGPFGAHLASLGFVTLGLTALLLPFLLGAIAWRRFRGMVDEDSELLSRSFGVAAVLIALPALFHLWPGEISWRGDLMRSGGAIGALVGDLLVDQLNRGGALVVLLATLAVGGTLAVQSTLGEVLAAWRLKGAEWWERAQLEMAKRRKRKEKDSTDRRILEHHLEDADERRKLAKSRLGPVRKAVVEAVEEPTSKPEIKIDMPLRVKQKPGEGQFSVRKVKFSEAAQETTGPSAPMMQTPTVLKKPLPENPEQKELEFLPEEFEMAELPPVNLLRTEREQGNHNESELMRRGEMIRQACSEFGVQGSIDGISPGPVITVYEMQPAPGVKVSKVVNLQDDLALVLKAESVRIDRVPGRSTLGLEVPNKKRSVIHLGRLLADDTFQRSPSVLTMAIGVDIHGQPYYSDLATMPHLLVAGATGAGKSVGLQSMITSILYKATREQVQFIFIDPKRIELGVYANIPHLKTEVVVEPKKAANALRWAVSEMERRYRLLAEVHVRSIDYYNRAIRDPKERARLSLKEGASEFNEEDFKPLPYYVIIIDELADLMMVSSSDVETSIARLAQMARAVGIHLIVATQRPSVDVLTGTIKANFPCRLAYATATRHDSRTILDQVGAEKLLGKGDALFMPPGTSRIQRLHGAYISEQETAGLIRWLKRRGKPQIDLDVVKDPEEGGGKEGNSGGSADDALYDEAARLVVSERSGSASFLQRRMRVGFSRASRLIDMMEQDGLLGPSQGSKPREVLVKPDFFEEIDHARMEE